MKKLLMILLALCAFACSAPMPGEEVSEAQEALGTCTKPTGGGGDLVYPADRYVSAIAADPLKPWRFSVTTKQVSSPFKAYKDYVDFGGVYAINSQAHITGPGWSSSGSNITEIMFYRSETATAYGCPNDATLTCMIIREVGSGTFLPVLYFDETYSGNNGTHFTTGDGLTAIIGNGPATAQSIKLYADFGSAPFATRTVLFAGPKLDACAYP